MTQNFPGPYQLRLYYDCAPAAEPSLDHVMQFNVILDAVPPPGTAFGDIDVQRRIGAVNDLSYVLASLVSVLEDLCSTADTAINYAELWEYEAGTYNASYISTHQIASAGASVDPGVPAEMETYTFRTLEGGIMQVVLLEQFHPGRFPELYSDLSVEEAAFADFFTDAAHCWFVGKDTSYPFVFHKLSACENENIFDKRFRL